MSSTNINIYNQRASEFFAQYEQVSAEQVHAQWLHLLDSVPSGLALDVGAGSGRDARFLAARGWDVVAVEPAAALRESAIQYLEEDSTYRCHVRWLDDSLPELSQVYALQQKYQLILVSAVWMHLAPSQRARALRKLSGLLAPGGLLVITLRLGSFTDGREAFAVSTDELQKQGRQLGLQLHFEGGAQQDQLGRNDVQWQTVVLRLPDDGSGAFSLLRHIVINDNKSSSYKLGLLRALLRIAEGHPGAVLEQTDESVVLPLGLVALYWLKLYRPLVEQYQLFQNANAKVGLGFIKVDGWCALSQHGNNDFYVGLKWQGASAHALQRTLRQIAVTIRDMPAKYITIPGGDTAVFEVEVQRVSLQDSMILDLPTLSTFGRFVLPKAIWDNLVRYSVWIEPALVNEWVLLMQSWAANKTRNPLDMLAALMFDDPKRSTDRVRQRVQELQQQRSVHCVWTGSTLKTAAYAVDHAFPFARWPNNDLWNLLPATVKANGQKSDRLPSSATLMQSKDLILNWWEPAWQQQQDEFFSQAALALPQLGVQNRSFSDVFEAMCLQRDRLRHIQQLSEWNGLTSL